MPPAVYSQEKNLMRRAWLCYIALGFFGSSALGIIFGTLRGIVHDPQHRPIPGAAVILKATASDYEQTTQTDAEGGFHFDAVPLGQYIVTVSQAGFESREQRVTVLSRTAPILHIELRLPTQTQSGTVSADSPPAQSESVTPTTLVDRAEIRETPRATRANSVAKLT